jgi:DNA replication and repair protein RecF
MLVRRLHARSFRNLGDVELDVAAGVTLVCGPNGAGKTNLLEALYFGLTGATWRTRTDRELIRFGDDLARVEVEVADGDGGEPRRFANSAVRGGGRHRRLDGKPVPTGVRDKRPPVGVFSPDRLVLVKGPPAIRRDHLDRMVAALWPARADARRRYGRALAQRNALLGRIRARSAPESELDAWDREIAVEGAQVIAARNEAADLLAGPFAGFAAQLGLPGTASLRYAPRSEAVDAEQLAAELRERRGADLDRGHTTHGPHLDELELKLEERSLRRFGSQGEQRTGLLALLLSERAALIEAGTPPPLLLLDDVMSELDSDRRRLLTDALAGAGQALITATGPRQLPEECERVEVRMREGRIEPLALAA